MPRHEQWRPYVPQAARRTAASRHARDAEKRGESWTPVQIETRGRAIAATVWGSAWCDNLERYHDYANRLPRGRTYVRNGSVVHLEIAPGRIEARVHGSELYRVDVTITEIAAPRWRALTDACARDIGSMVDLLDGRLSAEVMGVMTAARTGLFPEPKEITLRCSCPDWATMCKHVAAVMYGVGVRLDRAPQLLFVLRGVDPAGLVAQVGARAILGDAGVHGALASDDLAGIFGIEMADAAEPAVVSTRASKKTSRKPAPRAEALPKPAKPSVTKAKRAAAAPEVITRAELLARGVSAGTISGWYDRGVLESDGRAGVYRWTEALAQRLAARGGTVPKRAAVKRSR
jgi:uncharacterized Zn finger protein